VGTVKPSGGLADPLYDVTLSGHLLHTTFNVDHSVFLTMVYYPQALQLYVQRASNGFLVQIHVSTVAVLWTRSLVPRARLGGNVPTPTALHSAAAEQDHASIMTHRAGTSIRAATSSTKLSSLSALLMGTPRFV